MVTSCGEQLLVRAPLGEDLPQHLSMQQHVRQVLQLLLYCTPLYDFANRKCLEYGLNICFRAPFHHLNR